MSEPQTPSDVERWLAFARDDLCVARLILDQPDGVPRHACFHAQQSAEKALKGALLSLGIDFPKTHDLDRLRTLFPEDWAEGLDHLPLSQLTEWAVAPRYPGEWPEPECVEAREAVEQAGGVLAVVESRLRGT